MKKEETFVSRINREIEEFIILFKLKTSRTLIIFFISIIVICVYLFIKYPDFTTKIFSFNKAQRHSNEQLVKVNTNSLGGGKKPLNTNIKPDANQPVEIQETTSVSFVEYYEQGRTLYDKEDYISSIHFLKKALESENDVYTHYLLADCYQIIGKNDYAYKHLKEAIDKGLLKENSEDRIKEVKKKFKKIIDKNLMSILNK